MIPVVFGTTMVVLIAVLLSALIALGGLIFDNYQCDILYTEP